MRLVAAFAFIVLMMPVTVFAQAGSTGGTIGKTGKSSSGGEEQSEPGGQLRREPRSSDRGSSEKQSLPQAIRINEHNTTHGDFSSTLQHEGGSSYRASWSNGVTSRMTMSMSNGSVTFHRQDTNGPLGSVGLVTGTYTGRRVGNTVSGSYHVSNGSGGSWNASW
jgi:hypothetical protein